MLSHIYSVEGVLNVKHLNKLVRDKVPSLVTKDGGSYTMKLMQGTDHLQALKDKLKEETDEFIAAEKSEIELDELVDIVELVHSYLKLHNITPEEFEALRIKKRKEKGSFERGIYLTEISK